MKRIALQVLIGSVVVSALAGIVVLLSSHLGRTEVKVLLSSLCVTGASILALACAAAWTRARHRALPAAGIVLSIAGFGLMIALIWVEDTERLEMAWKTVGTLLTFATAAAHASLLSLSRLTPRHAWALPTALVINGVLACYLAMLIWEAAESDTAWRVLGILSILFAAFTILVPVFQRMGRGELEAEERTARPDRVLFCPRCGAGLDIPTGRTRCHACGTTFEVSYDASSTGSSSA